MVAWIDGNSPVLPSIWRRWSTEGTASSLNSSLRYYLLKQQTNTWTTWVTEGTTAYGSLPSASWTNWTLQDYQRRARAHLKAAQPTPPPILTPEQIAAETARKEAQERRWKAQEAARKLANDTAHELLVAHLTEDQKEEMKKRSMFVVKGGKSDKTYRIRTDRGVHGNIEELDKAGRAIATYCVQLSETVCPNGDHFLAQKLMLELAEEEILKIANRTLIRAA